MGKDVERQIHEALLVAVDRLGGYVPFSKEDIERVRDKVAILEDHGVRIATRAEWDRQREERDHRDKGHVLCTCGNWIERTNYGWAHIGKVGDDIPLHFASPA